MNFLLLDLSISFQQAADFSGKRGTIVNLEKRINRLVSTFFLDRTLKSISKEGFVLAMRVYAI